MARRDVNGAGYVLGWINCDKFLQYLSMGVFMAFSQRNIAWKLAALKSGQLFLSFNLQAFFFYLSTYMILK
jgi:hypothetical protein